MPQKINYNLDVEPGYTWIIAPVLPSSRQSLLYVQETGEFQAYANYYTTRSELDSYLIKITLGGQGQLDYKGASYVLKAGDFFWIDCSEPQSYRTDPETGNWHVMWVHVYGSNAAQYYETFLSLNHQSAVSTLPMDNHVRPDILQILDLYRSGEPSLTADLLCANLLSSIMTQCVTAPLLLQRQHQVPDEVRRLRSYLLENYTQSLTLDKMSQVAALNKYYLEKLFKKYVGYSPTQYLIHLRLTKSKELLRSTSMSVSEISYAVGIDYVSHYINLFKAQENCTPNQYRARWSLQK